MYVRDFETYKTKKSIPLFFSLIYLYFLVSIIFSIVFTIIFPIRISDNIEELSQNKYYFVQSNLFFINFNIEKEDLIIVSHNRVKLEKLLLSQFTNLLTLNFLNLNQKYEIYKVIGTPYDIINIKEGSLYINGVMKLNSFSTQINKDQTIYLSSGEYYCVSTYTNSLDDSLFFGIIREENILGKILKSFYLTINE